MTARTPPNPDAIGHSEAAEILGLTTGQIGRLIRDGVLHRVEGQHPTLSRAEVEEHARNPQPTKWVTGTEAARILGLSKTRVGQISNKGLLPFETTASGRRRYRRTQLEVISRARQIRWHAVGPPVVDSDS